MDQVNFSRNNAKKYPCCEIKFPQNNWIEFVSEKIIAQKLAE